jgi:hypothetical protein
MVSPVRQRLAEAVGELTEHIRELGPSPTKRPSAPGR